ncbi:hypothetical protein [Bradyrhizobium sp. AUGA SZCCT0431]|uniref:hypothetical protein n=1 Tax=Bradyrhizobium sp. AUGA SZCCT0431 TaxID=2807674 RepID=UPI001BA5D0F2|nr:hypothetical protein [Bradyrhizobium sp. AUGA SZCCT0431]MBR1144723.1 hypothetical protein [Bradyrhizobium sp. AUGA SZCCT0431]
MLEFDDNTQANMMTALNLGCKHLSGNFDTAQNRTRIGDAIVDAARSGKRTLAQFIDVALHEVVAIRGPKPSPIQAVIGWLGRCIRRA